MKTKRIIIATLLATILVTNSASACFLSNLFKSHTKPKPAPTVVKK